MGLVRTTTSALQKVASLQTKFPARPRSTLSNLQQPLSCRSQVQRPLRLLPSIPRTTSQTSRQIVTMTLGSDAQYPGTAVERLNSAKERASSLKPAQLNADWDSVRVAVLGACGLRDLQRSAPGQGYTGHCFADYNHCDCTTMLGEVSHNENQGQVQGIAMGNQLGPGIQNASDPELGPGGSWCTCQQGANQEPPRDVAHLQFKSRIAFKLVWCPNTEFKAFVLVDDAGNLLNTGVPTGRLPPMPERVMNYKLVQGSKYAKAAEEVRLE
mmetsp:Transcript_4265/g.4922  ORF Transcript_4265/g.4922 Transcript_4265/m.4922 type:complete len:269 (-) Transcript_4265:170-976(-)